MFFITFITDSMMLLQIVLPDEEMMLFDLATILLHQHSQLKGDNNNLKNRIWESNHLTRNLVRLTLTLQKVKFFPHFEQDSIFPLQIRIPSDHRLVDVESKYRHVLNEV